MKTAAYLQVQIIPTKYIQVKIRPAEWKVKLKIYLVLLLSHPYPTSVNLASFILSSAFKSIGCLILHILLSFNLLNSPFFLYIHSNNLKSTHSFIKIRKSQKWRGKIIIRNLYNLHYYRRYIRRFIRIY